MRKAKVHCLQLQHNPWKQNLLRHTLELEKVITVAPGKGTYLVSVLTDTYCKELARPHLFPSGKYGYKVQRGMPASASKYFNQQLLNYSQVFVADGDYIFFAYSVMRLTLP